MRSYALDARAERDLDDLWFYIALDNPVAADRAVNTAYDSFEYLIEMPEIGKRFETDNPRLADLRVWHIRGFGQYLIFYRITDDQIQIAYVTHSARDEASPK